MPQRVIAKDERRHRLYYWNCSRKNARIMTPARRKLALLLGLRDGFLLKRDSSGRLECHAKINVFAIADSALHATGIVCFSPYFSVAHLKWIIMLRAPHPRRGETGTDLKTFGGWYAQHRFCQVCFQLVENRFAEARGNAARDALDHAPDRVAFGANFLYQRYHSFRCRGVWATDDILFDVLHFHSRAINFRNDIVNLRDVGEDLEIRIQR